MDSLESDGFSFNLLVSFLVVAFIIAFHNTPATAANIYAVEYVGNAATGIDMNDLGDIIGTSRPDLGCGSTCLPPLETVIWRNGVRIVLPTAPGFSGITLTDMNAAGWIVGYAGVPGTTTHAVVWKPVGDGYQAIDLGNLPGKTISTAAGIDDFGRVVGWSTTLNFPPQGAPFMWTEGGGMVNLSSLGFPVDAPLGISPEGMVATYSYWYSLDDPGTVSAVPAPPSGYLVENSKVAINNLGEQVRFLVSLSGQNLVYPFRLHSNGTWQQISFAGTGHLSTYGIGSINDAGDATVTVQSTGMIAFGPDGLAQSIVPFVSAAFGNGSITSIGPINADGKILAKMIIGQSGQRLVRLAPVDPCVSECIRVNGIQMKGRGPSFCDQGSNFIKARLTLATEAGLPVAGATVTGHWLDDYYLDVTVSGATNASGQVTFTHTGPPCVGAIAFLVTNVSATGRTLDRTTGILTNHVIPVPRSDRQETASVEEGFLENDLTEGNNPGGAAAAQAAKALPMETKIIGNYPNPFNPSTTIRYSLSVDNPVSVRVYNMLGQEVATLVDGFQKAGEQSVAWHGVNNFGQAVASGLYFYRIQTGNTVITQKMFLMK